MTLGAGKDVFGLGVSLRWIGSSCIGEAEASKACDLPVIDADMLSVSSSSPKESSFFAFFFFFFGDPDALGIGVKPLYFAN